jgi:hypothetical protein
MNCLCFIDLFAFLVLNCVNIFVFFLSLCLLLLFVTILFEEFDELRIAFARIESFFPLSLLFPFFLSFFLCREIFPQVSSKKKMKSLYYYTLVFFSVRNTHRVVPAYLYFLQFSKTKWKLINNSFSIFFFSVFDLFLFLSFFSFGTK